MKRIYLLFIIFFITNIAFVTHTQAIDGGILDLKPLEHRNEKNVYLEDIYDVTDNNYETYFELPAGHILRYEFEEPKYLDSFKVLADGKLLFSFSARSNSTNVTTESSKEDYFIPDTFMYKSEIDRLSIRNNTTSPIRIYELDVFEKESLPAGLLRGKTLSGNNEFGEPSIFTYKNMTDGSTSTFDNPAGTTASRERAYITYIFDKPYNLDSFRILSTSDVYVNLYDSNGILIESGQALKDSTPLYFENAVNVSKIVFYRVGGGYHVYEVDVYAERDITPPGEVENIIVEPSNTELKLTWKNPSDLDLKNVLIYLDEKLIKTLLKNDEEYTIKNLQRNTDYLIKITTMDDSDNESEGIIVNAKTLDVDDRPIPTIKNLQSEVRDTSIKFTWDNPDDSRVVEVRIYRDGLQIGVAHTPTNFFIDFGLEPHTTYQFIFFNSDNEGKLSEGVRLTEKTKGPPRGKVTGLRGFDLNESVDLAWRALADPEVKGYKVYVDGAYAKSTIETNAIIDGLKNGTSYTIQVTAYNEWGESELSSPIEVKPEKPEVPSQPRLRASSTTESITLSWDPVKFARSYRIYEGRKEGNPASIIFFDRVYADEGESLVGETTATTFTIHGLEPGEERTFYVSAVNELGESPKAKITAKTRAEFKLGELGKNISDIILVAAALFREFWLFLALGLGMILVPRLFDIARRAINRNRGRVRT